MTDYTEKKEQLEELAIEILGGNREDFDNIYRSIIKYPMTLENYASVSRPLSVLKYNGVVDSRIVSKLYDLINELGLEIPE